MSDPLKSILWRTAITIAILFILAAGFYAVENARGVRAWQASASAAKARGESLDWNTFIPAPVPADKNFYHAPMMTEWFVKGATNPSPNLLPAGNPETTATVITEISASNYVAWCAAYEPGFDLMRTALQRPLARLDGDYTRPFKEPLPNFVNYRNVSQTLAHRAKCQLVLGEPAKALADLTLLHHLNQTLVPDHKPVTLVSSMVHVAIAGLYAEAVACGVASRSWREPELTALQRQLTEINLLPEVVNSFRAERAGVCQMLNVLTPDELMREIHGSHRQASDLAWWLMPAGWIYQNKALIVTLESQMLEGFDLASNTVSPSMARASNASINRAFDHGTPMNFIAAMCVPNFSKAAATMARNQTWVDQARIACALERYRLANGHYPATLAALGPQFIEKVPHDIISGKTLNYARPDDKDFRLYSIGWNEVDEGGITALTDDGKEDRENGDWVWQYPLK